MSISSEYWKRIAMAAIVVATCACFACALLPHKQVWAATLEAGASEVFGHTADIAEQASTIDEVRTLIEALPAPANVVEADAERIGEARAAYESLTLDEQRLLDTETNRAALHTTQSYGRVLELAEAGLAVLHEVDNSTPLPDGVYKTSVSSSWSRGKSASKQDRNWTAVSVRVEGGKALVRLRVNSETYSYVRASGVAVDRAASSADGESDFVFPVSLDSNMTFIAYSDTMATEIAYYLNVSVASGAVPDASLDDEDGNEGGDGNENDPVHGIDGVGAPVVTIDAETGNAIVEKGSFTYPEIPGYMFRIMAAKVTSDGHNMTMFAQTKSDAYSHLFMGTADQALATGKSLEDGVTDGTFIPAEMIENGEGKLVSCFTFPLTSFDKDIPFCLYSVKNEHWVNQKIRFNSADLEWRQTDEEQQQLQAVIDQLESLPARNTIVPDNPDHEAVVTAAREAYESLDRLRKSFVPSRLILLLNWDESMFKLGFNTEQLPLALVGQPYDGAIYVSGKNGDTGKTARVVEGALPDGLALEMDAAGLWARFMGTPQKLGSSSFTVEIDNGVETARKQFTIHVGYTPSILTDTVTDAQVGTAYEQLFQADAYPDATWSLIDGNLPEGLVFQDDGEGANTARITGTPRVAGSFTFTLACDNFANGIESRTYTLHVRESSEAEVERARSEKLARELASAKSELASLQAERAQLQNENAQLASKLEKANAKVRKLEAKQPKPVVITAKTVSAKTVKAALKTANNAYATKVTLGKNVTTIKANAFAGTDVRMLVVKTKKLSAKRVSGALRNSEVRAVKVNVKASAKKMKSIRKTYQRAFAKKNSGRKVTITFVS